MRIWAKTLSDSSLTMSVILRLTSFKILTGAACRIFSSYSSLFSISHPVPRHFLLPRHKSPSAQNGVKSMAHLLMTTTTETKKGRCQKSAMSFFQAYERKADRYHKRRTEMPADTCFAKAHSGQTILDITDTLYFETDCC